MQIHNFKRKSSIDRKRPENNQQYPSSRNQQSSEHTKQKSEMKLKAYLCISSKKRPCVSISLIVSGCLLELFDKMSLKITIPHTVRGSANVGFHFLQA